jgi:hypothetical protein
MADSRAEKILLASMRAKGPSEIEFGINKAEVAPNNPQIASQEEERHRMLDFLLRIKDSLPGGLIGLKAFSSSRRAGVEQVCLCRFGFRFSASPVYAYNPTSSPCISLLGFRQWQSVLELNKIPAPSKFSRALSYPKK